MESVNLEISAADLLYSIAGVKPPSDLEAMKQLHTLVFPSC
jgi:hypothetical protein